MAGKGPLPSREDERRRRNKPTIPTTDLPAGGFAGPYPDVPPTVELGPKGQVWWDWAWRTPEAASWSPGVVPFVARRASLEDDLEAIESTTLEHPPADNASTKVWRQYARDLQVTMAILAKIARGSLAVEREMREMDDRLGLNLKAFAFLRLKIIEDKPDEAAAEVSDDELGRKRADRQARLAAKA